MTDKTPIEKAAEDAAEAVVDEISMFLCSDIDPRDLIETARRTIEDPVRRRLEKEVPAEHMSAAADTLANKYNESMRVIVYNNCRRDIGLRDEEETG